MFQGAFTELAQYSKSHTKSVFYREILLQIIVTSTSTTARSLQPSLTKDSLTSCFLWSCAGPEGIELASAPASSACLAVSSC